MTVVSHRARRSPHLIAAAGLGLLLLVAACQGAPAPATPDPEPAKPAATVATADDPAPEPAAEVPHATTTGTGTGAAASPETSRSRPAVSPAAGHDAPELMTPTESLAHTGLATGRGTVQPVRPGAEAARVMADSAASAAPRPFTPFDITASLSMNLVTADDATGVPAPAPPRWERAGGADVGVTFEIPADWRRLTAAGSGYVYTAPDGSNHQLRVTAAPVEGAWNPRALLPANSHVIRTSTANVDWGTGMRYVVQRTNAAGTTVEAVEAHAAVLGSNGRAYDFAVTGRTEGEIIGLEAVLQRMLTTAHPTSY